MNITIVIRNRKKVFPFLMTMLLLIVEFVLGKMFYTSKTWSKFLRHFKWKKHLSNACSNSTIKIGKVHVGFMFL